MKGGLFAALERRNVIRAAVSVSGAFGAFSFGAAG
jgi:hypothetical protein